MEVNEPLNRDENPLAIIAITQTPDIRRLLDVILTQEFPEDGLNKTDIADKDENLSTSGIRRHIPTLLDFGLVQETTDEGARIVKYVPNTESEVYQRLVDLNLVLENEYAE